MLLARKIKLRDIYQNLEEKLKYGNHNGKEQENTKKYLK